MRLLITGASRGIGAALAEMISARLPDSRMLLVARDSEDLCALGARLEQCSVFPCDLMAPDGCEDAVSAAAEMFGGLDGVVSNAGTVIPGALSQTDLSDFDRAIDLNLRVTFRLAKAAYPFLKSSKGAFVATGSLAGIHAAPGLGGYSASKAGMSMLIRQLAVEWGPDGIRCNTVSPGTILTAMNAATYADPANRQAREGNIPMRRLGRPEEVAEVIYFLLQARSSFLSGADIPVDGAASESLMSMYLRNGGAPD